MGYSLRSLGNSVEYRPDRPIIHFGSPMQTVEAAARSERLEAAGFLIAKDPKEATK